MTELLLTPDLTLERRFIAIRISKLNELADRLSRRPKAVRGRGKA